MSAAFCACDALELKELGTLKFMWTPKFPDERLPQNRTCVVLCLQGDERVNPIGPIRFCPVQGMLLAVEPSMKPVKWHGHPSTFLWDMRLLHSEGMRTHERKHARPLPS